MRPWTSNPGGMGPMHMFFTWFAVRRLQPQRIVESGVLDGAGTWMLEQAAPEAGLLCIEPSVHRPRYTSRRAHYIRTDFSKLSWAEVDKDRMLLFFDDHQGWQRIQQAKAAGFEHVLYEDNYPIYQGNELSVKAALAQAGGPADWLQEHVTIYYEFPPIYANNTTRAYPYKKYADVTHPPLLTAPDPALKAFTDDVHGYYYMAYIRIKK